MKKLSLLLLPLLAAVAVFSGCSSKSVPVVDSGQRIRIYYNNDNFSYLEPCGCRISPIGGMDRRWNGMKRVPDESRVFVDAGNMLFKTNQASEYLAPQWYEQAVGVIEAYNLLKVDAVEPGATDFALGLSKFQQLAQKANFPFISSNIYVKETGKLLLKDSVIVERYGRKIGIFGVFSPALPLPFELEARDPIAHGKKMVDKLRSDGADMVIALSHQGYDVDVEFARKVKGIDLLVGAHSQSLLQNPDTEGDTLIVQLSNQGQMLGMVEYEASSLPKKRTDFVVDELNADYNEAPRGLANPMKDLIAVTSLRMSEANRKLDLRVWAAHEGKNLGYQTFLSCRDCHGKQAEFQEGKHHAGAFLTLVTKKQENNLDCVKCHSVGLGKEGGFKSMVGAFLDVNNEPVALEKIKKAAGAPFQAEYREHPERIRPEVARWIAALKKSEVKKSFVGVQCESCHGPRPDHPFGNSEGISQAKVLTQTCLQCHTKEQMPAWYDNKGNVKKAAVDSALHSVTCPR